MVVLRSEEVYIEVAYIINNMSHVLLSVKQLAQI